MCGRFSLISTAEQLKQHFALKQAGAVLVPRYNIAPNQIVVIIKNNILDFANWGFKIANTNQHIINARIETILDKPSFNFAFKKQRCLIVASGFFEWKTINNKKYPFYVQIKNNPIIGFAGIFIKDNCVILTTDAVNSIYKDTVHNRAPVIINNKNYDLWLNPKTPINLLLNNQDLQERQEDFLIYPVSTQVNNPKFDDLTCIKSL